MEKIPWFGEGLRFECTQCGNCCTGAPGYVWVSRGEIQRLADFLGLSLSHFRRQYVRKVHGRESLIERSGGDCVLFDSETRRCRVYSERPRQCRSWPFWPSNLRNPMAWQSTCQVCPGSGQGKLVPLEEIEARSGKIRI